MNHLEFRLKIDCHVAFNPDMRATLLDHESVEQMPIERVRKILQRVAWGDQYVVHTKFQEAGVFFTAEWVVLIVGRSHLHCVSVLCGLLKLMEEVFNTHVSIALVTVLDKPASPLYGYLARQAKLDNIKGALWFLIVLIMGGLIGAAINNWIWPFFFGGKSP